MKRKTFLLIGLMTFLLLGSGIAPGQGATEVKIGLLTPKTGALGSLGQTFENGAKLAIKDLNAEQTDYTFVLEVQDTKTDPNGAADAMTALAQAGVVGVVGAAASSSTLSAMPIAVDNAIPMISYASTSPSISTANDSDFLFRVVPSDAYQGQAAADLAKSKNLTKVAVIGLNDAYGQGLTGAFKEAFEKANGPVVVNIGYEVTKTDFSSDITSIANANPDGIFMVSFLDDGGKILDAIRANSALDDVVIIGTDGIASKEMYTKVSSNDTFKGVIGVAPKLSASSSFLEKFETEYNTASSIFVPEAYDATMLIGKAVIAAGEARACKVADNLRSTAEAYTDAATGTIKFDSNGDRTPPFTYSIWEANGTDIPEIDTTTLTGSGATGEVPETHCPSSSFVPMPIIPFLVGFGVLVIIHRKRN